MYYEQGEYQQMPSHNGLSWIYEKCKNVIKTVWIIFPVCSRFTGDLLLDFLHCLTR